MDEPEMFIIYKIQDNTSDNCYIGSTNQKLQNRMKRHEKYLENGEGCSSTIITRNDDYTASIINYFFGNKEERKNIECYYINNTPNTVNFKRLNFDKKEYMRQEILCDCGCKIKRFSLHRHLKTPKHLNLMMQCDS